MFKNLYQREITITNLHFSHVRFPIRRKGLAMQTLQIPLIYLASEDVERDLHGVKCFVFVSSVSTVFSIYSPVKNNRTLERLI